MKAAWLAAALCILPLADAGAQQLPLPLPRPQQTPQPLPRPLPTPAIRPQTYEYTARTAAPVRRNGAVTASSLTWSCSGSACTITGPWLQPGVSTCAALAREVGAIVSYGRNGAVLSAAQIAECNAMATRPPPAPAPSPGVAITTPRLFAEGHASAFAPAPVFVPQRITTIGLFAQGSPDSISSSPFTPRAITTAPLSAEGAPR